MRPFWTILRAAVIATHNRPAELRRCVEAIAPQVDLIVVVDNASDPPAELSDAWSSLIEARIVLLRDPEQPPNLSRLWNLGISHAREYLRGGDCTPDATLGPFDVAILNDDAVPPPGWFDAVAGAMREHGADAGSSDPFDFLPPGAVAVYRADTSPGVSTRLAGWAMVLRGQWEGARFDERFRWWCGDDDMSHRARQAGGLVHVGGHLVLNTGADTSTGGVLAEQSARDMQSFVDKWGMRPW
ncbi:MAG TPA: glycosyltransferase [Kofleriaceae bacterium]